MVSGGERGGRILQGEEEEEGREEERERVGEIRFWVVFILFVLGQKV